MTVWQEARGESYEGKVAVAEVILRRAHQKIMSDGTVEGACLKPYQFSGWNTGDNNRILAARLSEEDPIVKKCMDAWAQAEAGSNLSNGATHYYNPDVANPLWAASGTEVARIGHHRFMVVK